jgi:DNA-binding transcriptional MerR regulator
MTKALTVGEIARRLGWPLHKVDYLIRSRGIKPRIRAGNLRVFPESVLERLQSEHNQRKEEVSCLN